MVLKGEETKFKINTIDHYLTIRTALRPFKGIRIVLGLSEMKQSYILLQLNPLQALLTIIKDTKTKLTIPLIE
jgi:hypothetical protein